MYTVPGVTLIPQRKNMACWYASAQMVIQWKRNRMQATFGDGPDPSEIDETVHWEVANKGITNPQVIRLAERLGLRKVPPSSPTLGYLTSLLRSNGPLWTNGKAHIVVIAGVDEDKSRIQVYDPWPPNVGAVEWRDFDTYLRGGNAARDTSSDVQAVFLYNP